MGEAVDIHFLAGFNGYESIYMKKWNQEDILPMESSIKKKPAAGMGPRLAKWDNVKALLIILVVLGHVLNQYLDRSTALRGVSVWIYSFHMPLFIFLTGMFGRKTIMQKRFDRVFGFLAMYLFLRLIYHVAGILIYHDFSLSLKPDNSVSWYMFAMFISFLVTIAVQKFRPSYVLILAIALACLAGEDASIGLNWSLSRIIVFYPFFYAGFCLDPERTEEAIDQKSVKIGALVLLLLWAAVCLGMTDRIYWIRTLMTGRAPYQELGAYAKYGMILRGLYYPATALICAAVAAIVPKRHLPVLTECVGQRTLQIYGLHYLLIEILFDGLRLGTRMQAVWPTHYLLLLVPVALVILVISALKIWKPVFGWVMKPGK